jgi:predicted phage terminase large subunit-like protein
MTVFCAWDLAIGTRESNDWTVGVAGALDWKGDLHILEMLRFRGDAYRIAESICQLHFRWGASVTGMERGQLELAIRPTLEEEIRKRKRPLALAEGAEALVPVNDKVTRARPLQGLLQQGRVYLPQDQEWAQTLLAEMLRFPVGVYDDAVDAMAWLVRLALRVQPPRNPKELVQKARGMDRPWRDRLRANARDWRAA